MAHLTLRHTDDPRHRVIDAQGNGGEYAVITHRCFNLRLWFRPDEQHIGIVVHHLRLARLFEHPRMVIIVVSAIMDLLVLADENMQGSMLSVSSPMHPNCWGLCGCAARIEGPRG